MPVRSAAQRQEYTPGGGGAYYLRYMRTVEDDYSPAQMS
jgi:hypothetical protein